MRVPEHGGEPAFRPLGGRVPPTRHGAGEQGAVSNPLRFALGQAQRRDQLLAVVEEAVEQQDTSAVQFESAGCRTRPAVWQRRRPSSPTRRGHRATPSELRRRRAAGNRPRRSGASCPPAARRGERFRPRPSCATHRRKWAGRKRFGNAGHPSVEPLVGEGTAEPEYADLGLQHGKLLEELAAAQDRHGELGAKDSAKQCVQRLDP